MKNTNLYKVDDIYNSLLTDEEVKGKISDIEYAKRLLSRNHISTP